MLELKYNQPPKLETKTAVESSKESNVKQRLEDLQRADRSLYKMIGMEVWSIAKTMDDLYPGFWNQFMANRQIAMKNYLEQKQANRST